MPTFPAQGWPNPPVISPWAYSSLGLTLTVAGLNTPSAAAVVTQNLAHYVPFCVFDTPYVARQMFVYNGATVAGNIDLAIYDAFGNRLVTLGSTLMAGASALQWGNIADTTLQPGQYWMAFASNSATATFFTRTATVQVLRGCFAMQQASAFALPDPATFATPTASFIGMPHFGVSSRTF